MRSLPSCPSRAQTAARKTARTFRSMTPARMPGASAFENPSTSCSFLLAADAIGRPKTFLLWDSLRGRPGELLRVQLHDQLLVECRGLHVFAFRHGHHFGLELFAI